METMVKTKIEIIKETREFYENNPRAYENEYCIYENSEGLRCAHSRCLVDSFNRKEILTSFAGTVIEKYGDLIHKPEYRGHKIGFWSHIQRFHDFKTHWIAKENGKGNILTPKGEAYYDTLLETYK